MHTWHDRLLGVGLEQTTREPAGELLELDTGLVGLLLVGS